MLDRSLLNEFDAGVTPVHGLPAEAYVSDEFMRLENRYLFGENWVFAGFVHQFERSGDAKPVQIGGLPLFLLRDRDGRILAYHNVCRHRNLKLIATEINCGKLIRCPYHSWSYDLSGSLMSAPYFGGAQRELPENFVCEDFGLAAVACEVWHDWIFVNLSPAPQSFADFLAPLKRQLGDLRLGEYLPVTTLDFGEIACNWKLLLENFIEPYHVQFVHRKTTEQPLENHRTLIDAHCLGSAVDIGLEQAANAGAQTLGVSSQYLTLFPNFVLGSYQPDQLGVHLNQPLTAASTRQQRVIYRHRDAEYGDARIRQLAELWRRVHLEDHEMCLRLQEGRHSPLASGGGLLSPHWENGVRRFQELVADALRPGLAETGAR